MEVDKNRLVATLQSLIKIPSFENSLAISGFVKKELEGMGHTVFSDEDGNIITEIGDGSGFILNAHLDTVAPGEVWSKDPFAGVVEGGKVYGRGASDCKAGVAGMIEIARMLAKDKPTKRVVLTFTAFEEGYPLEKNGVYRLIKKLKCIERGISMESTTTGDTIGISIGCRGSANYIIDIIGKRGHSAYAKPEDNPINKVPDLMKEISRIPKSKLHIKSIDEHVEDANIVEDTNNVEDANNVDDNPAAYSQLVGKAVTLGSKTFRIPYLGKISAMFKK